MRRMQKLEKALEWALAGNTIKNYGTGYEGYTTGCGCCSCSVEIPKELLPILVAAKIGFKAESEGDV